jgi:hypothetical protein
MYLVQHDKNFGWRDHVLADFRDFRFSWGGFLRWTLVVLGALILAALITLYFLDWNELRGPISAYASRRVGREVRIEGNLKVDLFRLQPHVAVDGLSIGNPGWVKATFGNDGPPSALISHGEVEFRLFPALIGHWILPLVRLDQPQLLLVRDAQGRTNWDSATEGSAAKWKIPPIQRFLINDGHLEIDDAVRKLKFLGTITSEENAGGGKSAFLINGDGTLNGNKFLAEAHGGPLLNVRKQTLCLHRHHPRRGHPRRHRWRHRSSLPSRQIKRHGALFRRQSGRSLSADGRGAAGDAALSRFGQPAA